MATSYRWVQWNPHKKTYDLILAAGCGLYLLMFLGVSMAVHCPPNEISPPILIMRAFGTLAIILLHLILIIGPLARLAPAVAAPLLYNRRHLGVSFFLVALLHALVAIGFYGGFGNRNPVSAVVAGYDSFASISGFPFEVLGFLALIIFFVMAATSHDFWLKNLSPRLWKDIHMLAYVGYALVLLHIVLGPLQSERHDIHPLLLLAGAGLVVTLHIAAGLRQWRRDRRSRIETPASSPRSARVDTELTSGRAMTPAIADAPTVDEVWIDAGPASAIADGRGIIVTPAQRKPGSAPIAVFRNGDLISAVTNTCIHQGGPLGEGRIINGCITCPWHGYQFDAATGHSPPPFADRVATYPVRVTTGGRIEVCVAANPLDAPTPPARCRSADPTAAPAAMARVMS